MALGAIGVYWAIGSWLVSPANQTVRAAPARLNAQPITVPSRSGATLAAWLLVPENPVGAIVLLHGVRANRGDMIPRASLLWHSGYVVLVADLQSHGESTGDKITYGHLEAADAESCLLYLRSRYPSLRIGGVGVSLGGAAFALSGDRGHPDALVLEAVFPSIAEATDNRIAMRVGVLSRALTPLMLVQLKARLGVGPESLRPIDSISQVNCPVLLLSGTADRHTTEAQTRALFAAAKDPKELWLVPGATHDDLYRFDPDGYAAHVVDFLDRNLAASVRP